LKTFVARAKKVHDPTFEEYTTLLFQFFAAVRSLNPDGWGDPKSTYYKARVLRALIRLLTDIALNAKSLDGLTALKLLETLRKIDPATLSEEIIRAAQGTAGVTDLYQTMKHQVFA